MEKTGTAIPLDMIEAAEGRLRHEIQRQQDMIACLVKLESLAGKYITKRIEPKVKDMLPGYKAVSVQKESYSNIIEVFISQPGWDYWYDCYHLRIAKTDDRYVSAEMLKKQIAECEKAIASMKDTLEHFREAAYQWNNLVVYARKLSTQIYPALSTLQHGEMKYNVQSKLDILRRI